MDQIRVLIIDDHPSICFGLKSLFDDYDDIDVVGIASNGAKGLSLCYETAPDVVIIDLMLPDMDGIDIIRQVREQMPAIRFLVLTNTPYNEKAHTAILAGASGYLVKDASIQTIEESIRQIHRGEPALSHEVIDALAYAKEIADNNLEVKLSKREIEVLRLVVEGKSNPEIADELYISLSTVKTHIGAILKKLNARTRVEAVVLALQIGLSNIPQND